MFDNATWHEDATHLTRYLRWAAARGLLFEPLDAATDADVLPATDHKLVAEDLTESGAAFTEAYYQDGYLGEYEPGELEGVTFLRLDARLAEWTRDGGRSLRSRAAPPRIARAGVTTSWLITGAGALTTMVGGQPGRCANTRRPSG